MGMYRRALLLWLSPVEVLVVQSRCVDDLPCRRSVPTDQSDRLARSFFSAASEKTSTHGVLNEEKASLFEIETALYITIAPSLRDNIP